MGWQLVVYIKKKLQENAVVLSKKHVDVEIFEKLIRTTMLIPDNTKN